MATLEPIIKWSGSKRSQANKIKKYFPVEYDCYFEPFIGGGSILYTISPNKGIVGDTCKPLIDLWNLIKTDPLKVSRGYKLRWEFLRRDIEYYYDVRENFNKKIRNNESPDPIDFLFLTRTCANGLIRFNKNREFNTSYHFGRFGIQPNKLEKIVFDWYEKIKNIIFLNSDYTEVIQRATKNDIIYLDPPYHNTIGMYSDKFDYEKLLKVLEQLNNNDIRWIMSYDGKSGDTDHTVEIPKELYKNHFYIESGVSSVKRIFNKEKAIVFESLYVNYNI